MAIEHGMHDDNILLLAAQTHATTGNVARSIELAQEVLQKKPNHEPARFLLATQLNQAGKHHQALLYAQTLLAEHPNDPAHAILIGEIHEAMGEIDLAFLAYQSVLRSIPGSVVALVKTAELAAGQGDCDTARDAASKIPLDEIERTTLLPATAKLCGEAGAAQP